LPIDEAPMSDHEFDILMTAEAIPSVPWPTFGNRTPPPVTMPADSPPDRSATCTVCGNRFITGREDPTACGNCRRRKRRAEESRANGGRRFGVEIEVEWGGDPDDHYRYDDDDCNCFDCRQERGGRDGSFPSADTIAEAIREAGVPCYNIGYTHEVQEKSWKVVSDGSLNYGWEIVSPPLQWEQADQIRKVCETLSKLGAEPTEQCGLHVHHDVGDIDLSGMKRLVRCWHNWQRHTDRLCSSDRIDSQWCAHYNGRWIENLDQDHHRNVYNLTYDADRYQSLNISCFTQYGTVEVRQHESTLDAEEILSWIAYGQAVIDAALSSTTTWGVGNTLTEDLIDALPIPTSRARRLTAPDIRDRLKRKALRNY
jgi:hypothetical protein